MEIPQDSIKWKNLEEERERHNSWNNYSKNSHGDHYQMTLGEITIEGTNHRIKQMKM